MLAHKNLKSPFSKEPFYGETPESEHLKAKEWMYLQWVNLESGWGPFGPLWSFSEWNGVKGWGSIDPFG